MTGLVLELQSEAMDGHTLVSDLLRKALAVSKKLGVTRLEQWLTHELNGYPPGADVPTYRHIRGEIKVWNPYHGYQSLHFSANPELAEKLSLITVRQPVAEIDSLVTGDGESYLPFPEKTKNSLMRSMDVPLEPTLHVPSIEIIGILDAVRNAVLDWSLQLEQEGILGEGLTFSRQERQLAQQTTYQITNNIGSMNNSQLQQASNTSTQTQTVGDELPELIAVMSKISESLSLLELTRVQQDELRAEIATIDSQAKSPNPKRGILKESLQSVRNILEAVGGNVVAHQFIVELARFG